MKARFLAGSAVLALMAGAAAAQDLKFPVGEGAFNWDSFKAYDEATNLDGQTLKIFGPVARRRPGSGRKHAGLFHRRFGREGRIFLVGKL